MKQYLSSLKDYEKRNKWKQSQLHKEFYIYNFCIAFSDAANKNECGKHITQFCWV